MSLQIPSQLISANLGIVKKNPLLPRMLGATLQKYDSNTINNAHDCAMVGWGQKPSFDKASRLARQHGVPVLSLEDGFLRSVGDGKIAKRFGVSVVVDDLGIYFDTTQPSRLECLILDNHHHWNDDKQTRASSLIARILDNDLSKYNHSRYAPNLSERAGNTACHVLIIDQVAGDASIKGAGATANSFIKMIMQACQDYPEANIWLKTHPASDKGYLSQALQTLIKNSDTTQNTITDRVRLLSDTVNAIALLRQAEAVYTVSSHMGFEAILLGKKVHLFGTAWYAGFGLTDDTHAPDTLGIAQKRRQAYHHICTTDNHADNHLDDRADSHETCGGECPISVYQLFYAAYIDYSYYGDPACFGVDKDGQSNGLSVACEIEQAIDWLITNRTWHTRLQGRVLGYEFSRWKYEFVKGFASFDGNELSFKPKPTGLTNKLLTDYADTPIIAKIKQLHDRRFERPLKHHYDSCLTWGMPSKQKLLTQKPNAKVFCMEDGFVRSQGLGAMLIAPLSVVMDERGIYYDARTPSDLEHLLNQHRFDDHQQAAAKQLMTQLNALRITKYNVGTAKNLQKLINTDKPIHLVVGQVEDDASIKSCLSPITTNRGLLAEVRRRHPHDFIIYKPHPDVEAGLRVGQVADAQDLADFVASDVAMPDCLDVCDCLHTISSLSGFEALIRAKKVVCYGVPFYAGFGLTEDVLEVGQAVMTADTASQIKLKQTALSLRTHTLSLAELVYGVLIAYPVYRLPNGVGLAQAHQVVQYLADGVGKPPARSWRQQLKTGMMKTRHKIRERLSGSLSGS